MITFARSQLHGTNKGNAKFKNWKPIHTAVVMDRISGVTPTDLALKYNYTEGQISQICTSRQGKEIIARVQSQVYAEKFENSADRVRAIRDRCLERFSAFVGNETLATNAPIAHTAEVVKIYGALKDSSGPQVGGNFTQNTINNVQVNVLSDPKQRNILKDGLTEALEVQKRYEHVTAESVDGSKSLIK